MKLINKIRAKLPKRLNNMLTIGWNQWWDPYYQGFAAQMAFFYLLSIVPLVGVISQLLGVFDISIDYLRDMISQYVDFEVANILIEYLNNSNGAFTSVVMVAIAFWAASRGQFALGRIANYTMTGGETTGEYFRERFRALFTMLIVLITIVAAFVVLVYGEMLFKAIFGDVVGEDVILGLRWIVGMALYFLMISCNFYVLPKKRVPFKKIIPGATFASVGLLFITWLYSLYISYISEYNILYGSFATIVALLFWFYFLAWVMWLGLLVNKCWIDSEIQGELEEVFAGQQDDGEVK